MEDYKAMYYRLFNRVSEAIEVLQKAQAEAEHTFIESATPILSLLDEKQPPD